MWPYWVMYLFPAAMACVELSHRTRSKDVVRMPRMEWMAVWGALTLIVGLRHKVGGDWFNYQRNFEENFNQDFSEALKGDDPGYRLLEWLSAQLGWDMHGVNFLSAIVFSYGLVVFCRMLPRPWLGLALAVPYLVIVMGMGYSRQGIALGCIMASLVALGQRRTATFVIWAVVGATFHKSAVLLLPIAALAASERKIVTAGWVAVVVSFMYVLLLQNSVETLQLNYLEAKYESQGALIRLILNALPAAIFIAFTKRFGMDLQQERLWFWFAMSSFVLLGLYFLSPSSTAVDRIGLYLLPLQLVIFSHLPEVFDRKGGNNRASVLMVVFFYASIQFVWLNYAANSRAWIPYRFYPLESRT